MGICWWPPPEYNVKLDGGMTVIVSRLLFYSYFSVLLGIFVRGVGVSVVVVLFVWVFLFCFGFVFFKRCLV